MNAKEHPTSNNQQPTSKGWGRGKGKAAMRGTLVRWFAEDVAAAGLRHSRAPEEGNVPVKPCASKGRALLRVTDPRSGLWAGGAALVVACVVSGCAVGPDYHPPTALATGPLPVKLGDPAITNTAEWKVAEPAAQMPRGNWWEVYGDAELNRLETLAATNNQSLAAAVANFDQARAAVKVARADFVPQVEASPSVTRQRTSANSSPTGNSFSRSKTFNQFNVTGDASWELDLWGRVRRAVEGARARLDSSAADLESVRLSIQAEVAMNYFTLRSLDEQSALLQKTADTFAKALEMTRNRKTGGIATDLDVAQAETQLKSARAQIPAVDLQRAQSRHALAVLCGQAATTFALTADTTSTSLEQGLNASGQVTDAPVIPVSVPSEWLEHRPDIASAERLMAAANAEVGVAKAAFYPRVVLNASGGFESVSASTLFDWPSHLWAVGPSVQFPLFTGGRNRAQLASAKAAYDGAVASYRQTVLTAFQDVEDRLAAQSLLAVQLEEEQAALTAARRALDISMNRYKAGVEQYLDVITAQTAVLTHEQSVAQLSGQQNAASVALIKALGAGWDAGQRRGLMVEN